MSHKRIACSCRRGDGQQGSSRRTEEVECNDADATVAVKQRPSVKAWTRWDQGFSRNSSPWRRSRSSSPAVQTLLPLFGKWVWGSVRRLEARTSHEVRCPMFPSGWRQVSRPAPPKYVTHPDFVQTVQQGLNAHEAQRDGLDEVPDRTGACTPQMMVTDRAVRQTHGTAQQRAPNHHASPRIVPTHRNDITHHFASNRTGPKEHSGATCPASSPKAKPQQSPCLSTRQTLKHCTQHQGYGGTGHPPAAR